MFIRKPDNPLQKGILVLTLRNKNRLTGALMNLTARNPYDLP